MILELRRARADDCQRLHEWVNAPDARAAALTSRAPIEKARHRAWFAERLADADCRIWIIEAGGEAIGEVRLDRGAAETEIDIFVSAGHRGRGVARRAIGEAQQRWPARAWVARVRSGNAASRHLFESLGFAVAEDAGDHLVYRRRDG